MEIRNTTKRPVRVPLPGGKRLFLGPGGTGQIVPKATEHPPLAKLIEAGEIEVLDSGRSRSGGGGGGKGGVQSSQEGGGGGGGVRHTGDR
jgi:hypothetical protein